MERLEVEARSISAALDDVALTAIVDHVTDRMSGLLAGSTVAVTPAVVAWCRTAAATHPGQLPQAVAAGLVDGLPPGEGHLRLGLPPAAPGSPSLRTRIAGILKAKGAV